MAELSAAPPSATTPDDDPDLLEAPASPTLPSGPSVTGAPPAPAPPPAAMGTAHDMVMDPGDAMDDVTPIPSPVPVPVSSTAAATSAAATVPARSPSASASASASVAGARPKSPIVHGSYEKADSDEEEVMVKTEFVWADGAEMDVKLSGAWNGWMPVQMYHEGGGMWSVVTPVPAGTHEFKFVVDGEWKHSTRHPTVGEDDETMNNIRVIRGPPKNKQNTARLSEQRNKDAGVTTTKHKKCCIS